MKTKYVADGERFVIENYNEAPPFSDFFPALAGTTGKPLWVFFTNRGQAIAGFGVNNKDGAMMEFLPANKAYQATPILGFRTFVRAAGADSICEPFAIKPGRAQKMIVRPYEIELVDHDAALGLEFSVRYFGVPNDSCPALARSLQVRNIGKKAASLQIVDGLPRVVPFGMNDYLVKNMSRTIEAFAEVLNVKAGVPFFKLKIEPHDRPDIVWLRAGFFAVGLSGDELVPSIVDPSLVFGSDTSFVSPLAFAARKNFSFTNQQTLNIMPSAMFAWNVSLKPGESKTLTSYFGHGADVNDANAFASRVRLTAGFFDMKRQEMRHVYEELVAHLGLVTENATLNQYARTTFMDNVLRGGFPQSFGASGPLVHVFSRKHGDMERDYNAFHVSATYYSQGNGNFRDVNQNRRLDLLFNPAVGTANIETFFNLIQLDGFNPLVINPTRFSVSRDILSRFDWKTGEAFKSDVQVLTAEPKLAGDLYEFVKRHVEDPLNVNRQFRDLIAMAAPHLNVSHGEGFWIDHWIYNLDHLDQYLSVFPEKKAWLLFEKNDFWFYDSDHWVRPRKDKYVVTKDGRLRQYGAVAVHPQKRALLASRAVDAFKVRTNDGHGDPLQVTLFVKLLALATVKVSSLDPFGIGLEMEADKPGWCDALNGLPGIFGSSSHEMFELYRLVRFLHAEALPLSPNKTIEIPIEISAFMKDVSDALENDHGKDFRPTWDRLATARENFREKTLFGVSGKTRPVKISDIREFLSRVDHVLSRAADRVLDSKNGLPTSYFAHEVDVSELGDGWRQFFSRLPFAAHRVPAFLEGAVHAMRLSSPSRIRQIHQAVKRSALYDENLGMYRLNLPLRDESDELGRIRVFVPGWLENESIFLHMHYKYLLEMLRAGLIEAFLKEIPSGWVPFLDPAVYGRPTFENSSFIVSSAFPDPSVRGRGYVARLSGATAEFLTMLYLMMFGSRIFRAHEGGVVFSPEPQLPKDWFTESETNGIPRNAVSLKLFGVAVMYVNPSRRNTFGVGAVKPSEFEWLLDGRFYKHRGRFLPAEPSLALRDGRLENLTITLG